MHPSNFGVDQHGKTVLLDFAEIWLFPETFVAYTIFSEKHLAPIAIALRLSASSDGSMPALFSNLWMVGQTDSVCQLIPDMGFQLAIGLDERGNPKTGGKARFADGSNFQGSCEQLHVSLLLMGS
jgi:hypothetical protein